MSVCILMIIKSDHIICHKSFQLTPSSLKLFISLSQPSTHPSSVPSLLPSQSSQPSSQPSALPSTSAVPSSSGQPSSQPSFIPSRSLAPSPLPTNNPTSQTIIYTQATIDASLIFIISNETSRLIGFVSDQYRKLSLDDCNSSFDDNEINQLEV